MELDACQAKKRPVKKILWPPNREGRREEQKNRKKKKCMQIIGLFLRS